MTRAARERANAAAVAGRRGRSMLEAHGPRSSYRGFHESSGSGGRLSVTAFLELSVVLIVAIVGAQLAGSLSLRLGQPMVVGMIAAGLVLGPTGVHLLALPVFDHAAASGETLHTLAELGVMMLMFLAGLETDLPAMRRIGGAAFVSAALGVVVPFVGGWGVATWAGMPPATAMFVGTILTATSVSISAQTLFELGKLRTKEGSTILAAAVIDDVIGILVLSVVVALYASGGAPPPVWQVAAKMMAFFVAAFVLAPAARQAVRFLARLRVPESMYGAALAMVLLYGWGAEAGGGVAAITGAYLAGIVLARTELDEPLTERTRAIAYAFFVPIFFVDIGLRADLRAALGGQEVLLGLAIVGVAIVGKVVGAGLGARLAGFRNAEALRVGAGMVSRGEVGLIVAAIGVERGVIGEDVFALMVAMVVITTLITPGLLRAAFRSGPPSVDTGGSVEAHEERAGG